MSVNLILGSTSIYRKELLERLGLSFQCEKPLFNEEDAQGRPEVRALAPREMAAFLALNKAKSLRGPGRVVIGGDQLVHFNGQILGKPVTFEKAVQSLELLSGNTHELITAVALVTPTDVVEFANITRLTLKKLSRAEIEKYVQFDQPLDCAGSYKIEKRGIGLMDKIETDDFTAIQGLPLIQLSKSLAQLGVHP